MDTDEKPTTEEEPRKTEYDFYLGVPLSYSSGSAQQDATFIRLFAPSSKVSRECSALKQAFLRAVPKDMNADAKAKAQAAEADKLTGPDVIQILAMSADVDLPDALEIGRQLLLAPSISKVEGDTKLTRALLDRLDQEDFENMVGEYLVNFTLASALSKTKTD